MAPTTITITDAATGTTATVAPELGFNCFSFRATVLGETVEALDVDPEFLSGKSRPTRSGIPILFPFPNRIRQGRFTWDGREYRLPGSDSWGNAIHGFCADRPWRVVRQGPDFVTGQFQLSVDAPDRAQLWPADFRIEVEYRLIRNRLRAGFRILNHSSGKLPWGLGTHPYFRAPIGSNGRPEHCTVEVPASQRWELVDCLPTGKRIPVDAARDLRGGVAVAGLQLDDVYTGLECSGPQFDCTLIDERSGIQLTQTCPPIFREVVAFTPPNRSCICLEPYTCVTDAVNLQGQGIDSGLRLLGPGAEFRTWIDLTLGPILV
jgi:aldose 1-epimerase